MSSIADDSAESHAYFRAIEETFIRLRGAPLLLSPADWRVARQWHREGIPLEVIGRALEELFARLTADDTERRISSLRYCAPAVRQAWSEARSLAQGDRAVEARPLDPTPRLRALAASLPDGLRGRRRIAAEIESLGGEIEAIESRLRTLDTDLLDAASADLAAERSVAIEREVERSLEPVRPRLPTPEIEATRSRLFRQALRRELALPWLSLFSPDAAGGVDPVSD